MCFSPLDRGIVVLLKLFGWVLLFRVKVSSGHHDSFIRDSNPNVACHPWSWEMTLSLFTLKSRI
jgi:hypothetical protein